MKRLLFACIISAIATPLAAQGAWTTLFNGKDFTGWTIGGGQANGFGSTARAAGAGNRAGGAAPAAAPAAPLSTNPADRGWAIDNGVITSAPVTGGGRGGTLSTVGKFHDFELEVDYKLDEAPNVECTARLGEKINARSGQMATEQNLSKDAACLANSGIYFRSGYQLNLGRREAGEYIGVVMHRVIPNESIRGNVDWLSTGDCGGKNRQYLQDCSQFPEIRHKNDWNHLRIVFKGDRLQIWLNDKQITDVTDKPMQGEESWAQPAPISFQPFGESGGFSGKVQYRNVRIRTL
ncbi:MAG: DUF1080 domain-containing protein [Acidobacteria bacterium]|nr:DUF1080 domain-containing protein [Acidobacteriota bacterium]